MKHIENLIFIAIMLFMSAVVIGNFGISAAIVWYGVTTYAWAGAAGICLGSLLALVTAIVAVDMYRMFRRWL